MRPKQIFVFYLKHIVHSCQLNPARKNLLRFLKRKIRVSIAICSVWISNIWNPAKINGLSRGWVSTALNRVCLLVVCWPRAQKQVVLKMDLTIHDMHWTYQSRFMLFVLWAALCKGGRWIKKRLCHFSKIIILKSLFFLRQRARESIIFSNNLLTWWIFGCSWLWVTWPQAPCRLTDIMCSFMRIAPLL